MKKNDEVILFDGVTLADVMKEIYVARNENRVLITDAINSFRKKIKDVESASYIGKVVADLFSEIVKNDENLIKLAGVVQRIISAEGRIKEQDALITDEEKKQLLEIAREEMESISSDMTDSESLKKMTKILSEVELN